MAAAPVPPPDDPAGFFAWFEPHIAALAGLAVAVASVIWRASQLSERIAGLSDNQARIERKIDRLIEQLMTGKSPYSEN